MAIPFTPGMWVFPAGCIGGEPIQFVGTWLARQKTVNPPSTSDTHWNFNIDFDGVFSSLATGHVWDLRYSEVNQVVVWGTEPLPDALMARFTIGLADATTGQQIRIYANNHLARDAAGNIKVDFSDIGCWAHP